MSDFSARSRRLPEPVDEHSDAMYQAVVARRLQWDSLLWQVPVLSLTAQAFLYSISLGHDSSAAARIFASSLSIVVTLLCTVLMGRHRVNEIADSHWVADYETARWGVSVHGAEFRDVRDSYDTAGDWAELLIPRPGGRNSHGKRKTMAAFKTWVFGLTLFAVGSAVIIVLTIVDTSTGVRLLSS